MILPTSLDRRLQLPDYRFTYREGDRPAIACEPQVFQHVANRKLGGKLPSRPFRLLDLNGPGPGHVLFQQIEEGIVGKALFAGQGFANAPEENLALALGTDGSLWTANANGGALFVFRPHFARSPAPRPTPRRPGR